jgi:iron complex transport system substrate-binding protein
MALAAALSLSASTGASEPRAAARIVSLDLCTDWLLVKYAERSQILALSPLQRQYPLAWVGRDWPIHDGSLEQILHLQPELVITGEYNAPLLRRRLQELGVRVEVLALPHSLDQVTDYLRRFRALLGQTAEDTPPRGGMETAAPRPRLLLLGANGIGTGRATFEDEILRRAGWDNYLHDSGYVGLDLERLVTDPPDALLWSAPADPALANRFADHGALRRAVPAPRWLRSDHWQWECPGPWTWELVDRLHEALPR